LWAYADPDQPPFEFSANTFIPERSDMQALPSDFVVFTGNANPSMAQEIAHDLGTTLGAAHVGRFSDGEVTVEIQQNVRARDVFVVQSTCAPTNDNLMELLIMVDALKRASAERISAVIPYFGYARQDRRPRSARVPITAKVVANMLQAVGVSRVLTMDLHADQIQGFFDIPVDNIYASPVLLSDLRLKNYADLMVVSPDVGGVVRARALAKQLGCDMAINDKRRPRANDSEVMHVIGDIEGRNCVIMDDMIDTAGTLVKAAEVLKERGAKQVYAYCTHPIFSGPAIDRIAKGDALDEVVVTNTIPLSPAAEQCQKIRQLSVAPLIAETIQRISKGESVMSLFSDQDQLF
jgi:ribose-phosphate pyrophosphokinase